MKRNFATKRALASFIGAGLALVFLILSPHSPVALQADIHAYAKIDAHQSSSVPPDKSKDASKLLQIDDVSCATGSSCHASLLLFEVPGEAARIDFTVIERPERGHFAEGFREDVTTPPPLSIRA